MKVRFQSRGRLSLWKWVLKRRGNNWRPKHSVGTAFLVCRTTEMSQPTMLYLNLRYKKDKNVCRLIFFNCMSADYFQRVNTYAQHRRNCVQHREVQIKKNNCGIINVSTVCVQRKREGIYLGGNVLLVVSAIPDITVCRLWDPIPDISHVNNLAICCSKHNLA